MKWLTSAKICAMIMMVSLFLVPALGMAEAPPRATSGPPPVAQPLIREGALAVQLVEALNLGNAASEIEAETMLGEKGISPANGWIADYPVTPDIVGELNTAVSAAADAHKISMGAAEAVAALDAILSRQGVALNTGGTADTSLPAAVDEEILPPGDIYDYYYDEGPPVVTYYAPPPDYYYLYSWVPYPFWCSGFFFGGFFILNDFNRPVFFGGGFHHHHGRGFVSNHFRGFGNHGWGRVDPVTRSSASSFRGVGAPARGAAAGVGRRAAHGPAAQPASRYWPGLARSSMSRDGRGILASHSGSSHAGLAESRRLAPSRAYAATSGGTGRYRGYAPSQERSARFRNSYSTPGGSPNRLRGYSPATGGFARDRGYSPATSRHFAGNGGYSPQARSFAPRGGVSAPSFHGGFAAAPSFRGGGGFSRGGGGFSGGRGRR